MKLSVITICFNSVSCIDKTIASVISQDCDDFEYIIVDGGSSDGTLDIIKSYAAKDPRIRWISEPDKGISDAFNKGLRLATGELIGIINADDEYSPGALQAVEQECRAHSAGDVFHGDIVRMNAGEPLFILKPLPVDSYVWRQMPLNHPATFVRRRAYDRVGAFDVGLRVAMDYDLILRLYCAGCRFHYIDRPLAIMPYGGASDDRFIEGLREFREITIRYGYPRSNAAFWFYWKTLKGYVKVVLRKTGFQRLLKLHPSFR